MNAIFSLFAGPLGVLMRWIYQLIPSYFLALLIFTVLTRLILFPLSISNQKNQADRARLAPRLERIQKKYAQDKQKAMMKQQELYEKEGVKMTGGCLPMLFQMLVLFSVIAVIYKPVTYIQNVDQKYIDTCIEVAVDNMDAKKDKDKISQMKSEQSYYRELYLFDEIADNRQEMIDALVEEHEISEGKAADVVDGIDNIGKEFSIFGISLLEVPTEYGIKPNWLWIIVLASGLSAFASGQLSMHYTKASMSVEQQQAGGCNNAMMYSMPLMSLIFSFTVPAGVAVYWTFSNLLAMVQTVILNAMWNPAKIRAQAEAEYAERRRKRREDKERLKAARLAEQAAWQEEENKARARAKGDITQKKSAASTATPAELPQESVDDIPEESVSDSVEEE